MKIIREIPAKAEQYKAPETKAIGDYLASRVTGQEAPMERVGSLISRILSGIRTNKDGPRGSLLFLGPSGVGKTLTAEVLIEYFLARSIIPTEQQDARKFLLKVDCGGLGLEHGVSSLLGSPLGHVNTKGDKSYIPPALGQEAIDAHTIELANGERFAVVLIDEVEKASIEVRNALLGVLDKGEFQTASNDKVNFRHVIFIFTSNKGNREIAEARLVSKEPTNQDMVSIRRKSLYKAESDKKPGFRPEDIGRMAGSLESVVVFNELSAEASSQVLGMELVNLETLYKQQGINLEFQLTSSAQQQLLRLGISKDFGARALKQILDQHVNAHLLHPDSIKTQQALNNRNIFIDYDSDAGKFFFSTSELDTESNKSLPQKTDSTTNATEVKKPTYKLEIEDDAKKRLKELNVSVDFDKLNFRFLNPAFPLLHNNPINIRGFAESNNCDEIRIATYEFKKSNLQEKAIVIRLKNTKKGIFADFVITPEGLPEIISIDGMTTKQEGRTSFAWVIEKETWQKLIE